MMPRAGSRLVFAASAPASASSDAMTRPRRLHPYRRSPRFVCHFDGLAAVEVQSIMQMLDQTSLLRLARCSRRMHSDANSDAAWNSQPLFDILLDLHPGFGPRMQQSLLRHLPVVEAWTCRRKQGPPVDVQAMLSIPRITQIGDGGFGLSAEEWLQVFSHPCTAGLTTLSINDRSLVGALPVELTTQLVRLTRLSTIGIRQTISSGDLLLTLPTLPALTELTILNLSGPVDIDSILPPALHACTQLIDLSLALPKDDGDQLFQRIFCDTSPAGRSFSSRLQRLYLGNFDLSSLSGADRRPQLDAAFASLISLRHLRLYEIMGVDDLMPSVERVTSLRELHICVFLGVSAFLEGLEEDVEFGFEWMMSTTPSVDQLEALMRTNESVTVTLDVPPEFDPWREDFADIDPERFQVREVD